MSGSHTNSFDSEWLHAPMSGRTLSEESGDIAGGIDTSVQLFVGETFSGVLGFDGDSDWFYLDYLAGNSYTIRMTPGTMLDPMIYIADSSGTILKSVDYAYDNATETHSFYAFDNGRLHVIADSYYNSDDAKEAYAYVDTGTYALAISINEVRAIFEPSDSDNDDIQLPPDYATRIELSPGDMFLGEISSDRDVDWFSVDFQPGFKYTITMVPETMQEAIISFQEGNHKKISINEYSPFYPETLVYRTLVDTTLYIEASSLDTGTYTLLLSAEAEEFTDTPLDAIKGDHIAPSAIDVYFVPEGMSLENTEPPISWSPYEQQQAMLAFRSFEEVANISFNHVTDPAEADFFMVKTTRDGGHWVASWHPGVGLVEVAPGEYYDLDGLGIFKADIIAGWEDSDGYIGLAEGGFAFNILLHEIGHGLGLAHPHDDGFGSTIFPGVLSGEESLGSFELNQGHNTVMSYNAAWILGQDFYDRTATPTANVWAATPMALDIAVLQDKYGANIITNDGDTIYDFGDPDAANYLYSCIWDAGGTDKIRYNGNLAAVIDLRDASLAYEVNGGGHLSYALAHFSDWGDVPVGGGFTIAAGVIIENAKGGSGSDLITGNSSNNLLEGGNGDDTLLGGDGDDTLDGGSGTNILSGGDGFDTANYATAPVGVRINLAVATAQNTFGTTEDTLISIENLIGSMFNDVLNGDAKANRIYGGSGDDVINGGAGNDTLDGGWGSDIYIVTSITEKTGAEIADTGPWNKGQDELRYAATATETLTLFAGDTGLERIVIGTGTGAAAIMTSKVALNVDATLAANSLSITGNAGKNVLTGSPFDDDLDGFSGNDVLIGGAGEDTLIGGLGRDTLTGGSGNDIFYFSLINESGNKAKTSDVITDFVQGADVIDLSTVDNINGTFTWRGTAKFTKTRQGEVRYKEFDVAGTTNDYTMIWVDNGKNRLAEMAIRLTGLYELTASDFIL